MSLTHELELEFNNYVREVFDNFSNMKSKFKVKLQIKEMQNRMLSTIRSQEDFTIRTLGPYLLEYGDDIVKQNDQLFLEKVYNMEMMKLSKQYKFDYQESLAVINHVKSAYKRANDKKKNDLRKILFDMLQCYAKWLKQQQ